VKDNGPHRPTYVKPESAEVLSLFLAAVRYFTAFRHNNAGVRRLLPDSERTSEQKYHFNLSRKLDRFGYPINPQESSMPELRMLLMVIAEMERRKYIPRRRYGYEQEVKDWAGHPEHWTLEMFMLIYYNAIRHMPLECQNLLIQDFNQTDIPADLEMSDMPLIMEIQRERDIPPLRGAPGEKFHETDKTLPPPRSPRHISAFLGQTLQLSNTFILTTNSINLKTFMKTGRMKE
jgi:hypothetical protein